MHRILALGLFGIMILTPLSVGSPIDGSFSKRTDLRDDAYSVTKTFRAGERASVLAFAIREAPTSLHISVFNAKNELVAEDKADGSLAGNIGGVIWYPSEDGEYRIEVRMPGVREIYVAVK
jgi:hypothetical protein